MSLPPEVEASFATIIDSILAASDLNTISEKRIRKGLQEAVQYDITPQKAAIKALIMTRFDIMNARKSAAHTNGHTTTKDDSPPSQASNETPSSPVNKQPRQQDHEGDLSDVKDSPTTKKKSSPPAPKKHKQEADEDEDDLSDVKDSPAPKKKRKVEYDSDAAFAAKLQAQENSRVRSTRGGGPKKAATVKKKKDPKKKTSAKVKAEDDSDLDGSGSEVKEKKVNRSGGFHKEMMLSPPLSALLDNEIKLSRPQTVKRIWAYIRAHDLQDPKDKRMIRCDEGMRAVFKQDKVHMFTMNKILNQNLYNMDE